MSDTSRIEAIRASMEKYGLCYASLHLNHPTARQDMEYLLDRVEKLERVAEAGRNGLASAYGDGTSIAEEIEYDRGLGTNKEEVELYDALAALDADEKEPTCSK